MSGSGPKENPFPPLSVGRPADGASGGSEARGGGKGGSRDSGGPEALRREGAPRRTDVSDEALMMCVQSGDLTSLQELLARHERPLYNFLARYTGDGHLAEDLFQDCFVRLVEKRHGFDPARGFRPWLYSVAANLARDACRRREVRSRDSNRQRLDKGKRSARPDEEAARIEESELVREMVDELPGDARAMVLLHFFQGLTYREIASALDAPVGTVKSRMHWAVQKLAERWTERAATVAASGSLSARRR